LVTNTFMYCAAPKGERQISRRAFVLGLGAAAAGALLAAGGQLPPAADSPAPSILALRRSLFAAYLGQLFQVSVATTTLPLQLIDVRSLHAPVYRRSSVDHEQNFSLLFRGAADQPLGQDSYRFAHGRIGSFQLFIVPVRHDPQATYYEAIFGRQPA
jgi:hypothetical protein